MNYFTIADAIELHDQIISNMGGANGYNEVSIGYLDSALEQIQNDEYYPTFIDKLTHLVFSCVKFHPFLDGNKRTSIYLGIFFLELNDLEGYFVYFADKMEDVVVDLASGKVSKEELKEIITNIIY
ncbi:type II toxin-antitoxin system death-on-curing family toxin [Campylobacter pinnipediorum]|uniref:Death-on-curing protein n=1 Tax=Campylobacter pinnipediorum subsp. pinnipediorum TaxID=1660067 RepID=A0AAX0L9N9_9BACT|nr:type II toxin-antitoxin system death-on-curing family toxin [Campylobacter pinnipediorum]AQW81404.1 Fic/DOC family protein [Campylobacter pinnipediorum subsp. pinnipediorum]AQW83029.1 Fic/DOC family protein [Campylobacter pinnipediorum subsp. pinnipediorum]OPA77369.1 death-on-curing protein [Campylobacter pinnipediorum subsp. pinnipediorum]